MRQWGGHHLPCYSAERTPIHVMSLGHILICMCVCTRVCEGEFASQYLWIMLRATKLCLINAGFDLALNCFFLGAGEGRGQVGWGDVMSIIIGNV